MNNYRCPYLGLAEDPGTALDFPSEGNLCHRSNPTGPIKMTHQTNYCLTGNHTACPVFNAKTPKMLPNHLRGSDTSKERSRRELALISIPVTAAMAAVVGLGLNFLGNWFSLDKRIIPISGSVNETNSFGFVKNPRMETITPLFPSTAHEPRNLDSSCRKPEKWIPYVVQPTDSLYRLSALFRISINALREANCMNEKDILQPGQVLYVPEIPSSTSSRTPTITQVFPTWTFTHALRVITPDPTDTARPPDPTSTEKPAPVQVAPKPTKEPKIDKESPKEEKSEKAPKSDKGGKNEDKGGGKDNGKDKGKGKGKDK